jgi:hypothetical protein
MTPRQEVLKAHVLDVQFLWGELEFIQDEHARAKVVMHLRMESNIPRVDTTIAQTPKTIPRGFRPADELLPKAEAKADSTAVEEFCCLCARSSKKILLPWVLPERGKMCEDCHKSEASAENPSELPQETKSSTPPPLSPAPHSPPTKSSTNKGPPLGTSTQERLAQKTEGTLNEPFDAISRTWNYCPDCESPEVTHDRRNGPGKYQACWTCRQWLSVTKDGKPLKKPMNQASRSG